MLNSLNIVPMGACDMDLRLLEASFNPVTGFPAWFCHGPEEHQGAKKHTHGWPGRGTNFAPVNRFTTGVINFETG